jgi:hypothetical protein
MKNSPDNKHNNIAARLKKGFSRTKVLLMNTVMDAKGKRGKNA